MLSEFSLGRIPKTSCGAFEAEPPDPTDGEEAYEAWAKEASATWAEVTNGRDFFLDGFVNEIILSKNGGIVHTSAKSVCATKFGL